MNASLNLVAAVAATWPLPQPQLCLVTVMALHSSLSRPCVHHCRHCRHPFVVTKVLPASRSRLYVPSSLLWATCTFFHARSTNSSSKTCYKVLCDRTTVVRNTKCESDTLIMGGMACSSRYAAGRRPRSACDDSGHKHTARLETFS
jgi:hypothetical protein